MVLASFLFLFCIVPAITYKKEEFTEELLIKPLYAEQLYAHFQFTTKWHTDIKKDTFSHSRLFPRALGEILKEYSLLELHISLTSGLWRYEQWGYPVYDAAPGAEVWAWFQDGTESLDEKWKLLSNRLSGLFCASINFVDRSNSISPEFSFRPRGVVENVTINNSYVRYASLPRELVCTENLTPWKKLLPCDTRHGLASLLNSEYIHNTRYHSLGIHFRQTCSDSTCTIPALELQQTISLVYDYKILGTKDWSFRKLFGQGFYQKCALADRSDIFVDTISASSKYFELEQLPDDVITSFRGGYTSTFAKYTLKDNYLSLSTKKGNTEIVPLQIPPYIHANQYLIGYGQEKGGIVTKIYNNFWKHLDVILLQNIPWYVPIYLHTLKIVANGRDIQPFALRYIPGKQREKPYYLEVLLRLPPQSTTTISVDFDYIFLKWQEYPPDANHGFYIGSAIISAYLPLARNFTGLPQDGGTIRDSFNASRNGYLVQVRTESLVITLPTPDFSMPYNVICLACTVVALAFGPLHNITTRKLVLKPMKKLGLLDRLKKLLHKEKAEAKEK